MTKNMASDTIKSGNTKGGSIIVPLTSCLTGLDYSVLQIKPKIDSCHTADSKPVKQEVNSTVIHPPLVFPDKTFTLINSVINEASFLRLDSVYQIHFQEGAQL